MKWLELHLDTQPAGIEPATELLSEYGIDSLMIDEEGDFKDFLENNHQYWDYVDDELVEQIKLAGRMAGENYWQLPSLPECKEAIKSDVADLLNSAGRAGGCITGGLFIGEFVDKDIPWAHLDIGGTSTATKTNGFKVKGGTAFGTMTLIKLAGML